MSATQFPERGPSPLIPIAVAVGFFAGLLAGRPAKANDLAVIWYRIEVRACQAEACRHLPVSARRWDGEYACQSRAALIERFAEEAGLPTDLPPGTWSIRTRCAPIVGWRSA